MSKFFTSPKPVAVLVGIAATIGAAAFVGMKRRSRLPEDNDAGA